ncbi:AraC family transcriptional regulator [Gulosibacter molinativorax]|uniref:AraC family transcriptional regulator n=1 Tax=Gulosibacter molinativorax TaxID=256821 RepID=A0ABT7C9N1_9MICO|nr:AraC family transcriptional regulator [Gulosibacter molinativorax]MDJ1371902.1 AraC family transcriptional regulator [Gulosibacter molinativorax]QUY62551.1 Hypotetical protein [Gulosibacter molinativorax]
MRESGEVGREEPDDSGFAAWQAEFAAQLLPFRMRDAAESDVAFTVHSGRASDVRMARFEAGTHDAWRGKQLTATAEPAVIVCQQVTGRSTVAQSGREVELLPGDFTFYRASEPVRIRFLTDTVGMITIIPERRLSFDAGWLATVVARKIDGDDPIARGFAEYLRLLEEIPADESRRRAIALEGAISLFETTVRGAFDVPGSEEPHSANRRELYDRAVDIVAERAVERGFTLAALAEECFVSPRQLQAVFAEYGRTFRGLVVAAKVGAASRMLRQERYHDTPLATIARECGFSSASHFTQQFHARVGTTPSAYRKELLRRESADTNPAP